MKIARVYERYLPAISPLLSEYCVKRICFFAAVGEYPDLDNNALHGSKTCT